MAVEAPPSEVLASAAFQTCSEQLGQLVGKAVAFGPATRHDLAKWPDGQVPAKWLLGDMAFDGDLKGNIYLAMEEKPFFAIGAFLRDMPAPAIKERLASVVLNDSDIDGIREVANILSGALDDTLRATTGKKTHLKLVKFDVASKMPPHPDANRIAFTATVDIDGGLAKGAIALVCSATLGEFLGVPGAASTPSGPVSSGAPASGETASAGSGSGGTAQGFAPAANKEWWKAPAPKASALLLFGTGEAVEKAAAIGAVLKIACHRPKDAKEFEALLAQNPAAAVFVHPSALKDPWLRTIAETRKSIGGKSRRLVVSLPSASPPLQSAAYALPPTGVWAPPYDPIHFAKLLLAPIPSA